MDLSITWQVIIYVVRDKECLNLYELTQVFYLWLIIVSFFECSSLPNRNGEKTNVRI